MTKKIKNAVLWTYVSNDFKGNEIVQTFYKKNFKKNQRKLKIKKGINKKDGLIKKTQYK